MFLFHIFLRMPWNIAPLSLIQKVQATLKHRNHGFTTYFYIMPTNFIQQVLVVFRMIHDSFCEYPKLWVYLKYQLKQPNDLSNQTRQIKVLQKLRVASGYRVPVFCTQFYPDCKCFPSALAPSYKPKIYNADPVHSLS